MAEFHIMKDAEEFYYPGNNTGVLVIHGFTGSTQSMRFLGEQLAEAGFTIYGPRLTGHGTAPEDMEKSTYQEWIQTVEDGLEKLKATCSAVFVTGLSMGGTLTLYLAENHPEIKGIVPINAAIEMPELIETYEQHRSTDTKFVDGIGSDIKKEGVEELAYPKTPVKSMGELINLSKLVRSNLAKINVPALIFSSTVDHVVPPENSQEIYESIISENRSIIKLENSFHVATLDNDKELIAEKSIEFIKSIM
ncbi:alpha/beta fold hydrolase [Virgibacillus dakarensis]|uniref:Carboxylesterase n=1 Tax=Lentibacillus populi TaxID=1827502 RepID=A0A9W5TWA7_9BACI|nr:alpha/beta fold hydrolase [Lentibacillus populi]MBT2218201.1 alpha/beta fold hydrolase [Virgibacillus dakarensis]MTW87973.1 alpha/beta fold hydrolase [Virgibacillus dakarensis]GGB37732.1 carboxylesterase [Lentibacillus populi]